MRITHFLLFILILSCGRKAEVPSDRGTKEQQTKIQEALRLLQSEFDELNVKINLKKYPVIVRPMKKRWGQCTEGKKKYITINPEVFDFNSNEDYLTENALLTVLLHEIGHCYFGRDHETSYIGEENAQFIPAWHVESERYILVGKTIPATVMIPGDYSGIKPLRKYYVAETAGLARASDYEDLREFADFQIVRP